MRGFIKAGMTGLAILVLGIAGYLLLLFFPQPVFAHVYHGGRYALYSVAPLDATRVAAILNAASERLVHAEFYDANEKHSVFVAGSRSLHYLFNGPNGRGMARNSEIGERIFVPTLDIAAQQIVHFEGRRERAAPILAHEATHTYIRREVGLLASHELPFWLREGYGEYIAYREPVTLRARVTELPPESAPSVETPSGTTPRHYYLAGLMWEYLLDVRGMTARQVLREKPAAANVEADMRAWAEAPG
jgi:hypothetical protein